MKASIEECVVLGLAVFSAGLLYDCFSVIPSSFVMPILLFCLLSVVSVFLSGLFVVCLFGRWRTHE